MPDLTRYCKDMEKFRRGAQTGRETNDNRNTCRWSIKLIAASTYAALVWAGAPFPPGESRSFREIARDAELFLIEPGYLPKRFGQWLHENVVMTDIFNADPDNMPTKTAELLYTRGEAFFVAVDELLQQSGR